MTPLSSRYLLVVAAAAIAASVVLALDVASLPSSPLPRADGARVLAIVVAGFDGPEYREIEAVLEAQGAVVVTASFTLDEVVGEGGTVKPDIPLDDVDLAEYDAILMPGGYHIRANIKEHPAREALYDLIRRADNEGKLIAAICRAPSVLGDAGVIGGRRVTGYDREELKAFGAIVVSMAVVEDENIITASGPAAARVFAGELVKKLAESTCC